MEITLNLKSYFFLFILLLAGWIISFYFYQVHKKRIPENVFWMPNILNMADCRCDEIVDSTFGRTFGKSNAFWGMFYYIGYLFVINGHIFYGIPRVETLFFISLLSFAFSIYLAWGLYILKVFCRPCLGAHIINGVVFCIILVYVWPLLWL
ncbi:MAG: vitamin K epoxide reductase family protein [Candidatus Marinimicrobia bacterium]|nr:vitamin K epoxide reductase family protein [Candidatus Neomarinimicrobiota bacterium]